MASVMARGLKVSIHARHCWRANPQSIAGTMRTVPFQSTPAIAGGRIWKTIPPPCVSEWVQSTPAIAGGRIARSRSHTHAHHVSIHARHCWRANRRAKRSGRTAAGVSIHARHCWRANPGVNIGCIPFISVSIHARHCWRANLTCMASRRARFLFQSTPAIAGGRISRPGCCRHSQKCFNPRPPLLAGESRDTRSFK